MLSIVKNHLFVEEQRRRCEFACGDVGPRLGAGFPAAISAAVIAGLGLLHFFDDPHLSNRGRAIVDPNLVPVSMIAVMMGIKNKADGLARDGLDFRDYFIRAGRKVTVNHQHVILENDPSVIAVSAPSKVAFVK